MLLPQGNLQVLLRHKTTKRVTANYSKSNIVVYQAGDILAKVTAGEFSFAPTHIYGEHASHPGNYTEGVLPPLTAALTDTIATLRISPRSTTDAESAILTKGYNKTTEYPSGTPVSYWAHNNITFTATIGDSAVDNDIFVGAGLVTVVLGQEYLFAHQYHPGLVKLPSFEIVYLWTIRYT